MSVISVQDERIGGVSTARCLPAGGFGDNFGVFRRGALPVKPRFCAGCGA